MNRKRGRPPHADLLTPSEWRTVHFVQHGLSNAAIAARRGISIDAVKFHVSNALAKLRLRNRRELRAWFRAPADSGLARKPHQETGMNISKIGQISRSVSDTAASEKWYREVLGLPHFYTFGTLAFFDIGGTRLMLSQEGGAAKESIIYLQVADIAAGASRAAGTRREVHACAAHDPPSRGRHGGVDGLLRGSGWAAARDHGAGPLRAF